MERVAIDQKTVQDLATAQGPLDSDGAAAPTAAAKRELRQHASNLAVRSLALQSVANKLHDQQKALEAAGNASAKQLARIKQDLTSCGFWVLHYIEEELRRFNGEGCFSFYPDLGARLVLLNNMADRLRE